MALSLENTYSAYNQLFHRTRIDTQFHKPFTSFTYIVFQISCMFKGMNIVLFGSNKNIYGIKTYMKIIFSYTKRKPFIILPVIIYK